MEIKSNDDFLRGLAASGIHYPGEYFNYKAYFLFRGIDFKDKTVVDIGCGNGVFSFYAVYKGAKKAVCLEPLAEGSNQNSIEQFLRLQQYFQGYNIILKREAFQSFDSRGEKFDVILLHNSINHLDEEACINLLKDRASRLTYKEVFNKLSSMANPGCRLIICDCSRHNFFASFKIKNPFAPTIEWHKHQRPQTWIRLLKQCGFEKPKIEWSVFRIFGRPGRVLLNNELAAYFTRSYFCLKMIYPQ